MEKNVQTPNKNQSGSKALKWTSRIAKVLFSLMLGAGATAYFLQYDMAAEMFASLGIPVGLVYPLAIAKYLGIIGLWQNVVPKLRLAAYIAFAAELALASGSHLAAGDGQFMGPLIPLVMLAVAFFLGRKAGVE